MTYVFQANHFIFCPIFVKLIYTSVDFLKIERVRKTDLGLIIFARVDLFLIIYTLIRQLLPKVCALDDLKVPKTDNVIRLKLFSLI